jgi:hypothetical protein
MVATDVRPAAAEPRVEDALDRWVAGLPWGVGIFLLVLALGLWWVHEGRLEPAQFLQSVSAGSGLLAIGHGIRRRGR